MNEEVDIPFRGQEIRNRAPNLEGIVMATRGGYEIEVDCDLFGFFIWKDGECLAYIHPDEAIRGASRDMNEELRNRRTILSTLE